MTRHHQRDRGAATAETVVAMPLLLLLVLLVIQFGIWAHAVHVAQAAAVEGLTAARVDGGTAAAGQQRAEQVRAQIGRHIVAGAHISVTRGLDTAAVDITGTAPRVVPLPFLHFPIHVHVTGSVEHFRPDTGITP